MNANKEINLSHKYFLLLEINLFKTNTYLLNKINYKKNLFSVSFKYVHVMIYQLQLNEAKNSVL